MKLKEIGIWTLVVGILIGGLWLLVAAVNNSSSPSNPISITAPEITKDDFSIGTASAKVTLIEYGDFQCPACGKYFPFVKNLESDFKNDLKIIYRFFPLNNIHPNAMIAAQAAYAASKQNKFWEMHDKLYENQDLWANTQPRNIFIDYAKELGLNLDRFGADIDDNATRKFINDEEDKGTSAGVNSTPTFFVNGKSISNPSTYEEFKKIIQNEINKK